MRGLIKNADFLSKKPELYINGNIRYSNIIGGVLSILTSCLVVAAGANFTLELFLKNSSIIMFNQIVSEKGSLNISNLPFIIMLQDENLKPLIDEERLYEASAYIWYNTPDNSSGSTTIKAENKQIFIERCNLNIHFGEYRNYFKLVPFIEHHYCLKPGSNNLTLYGIFGSIDPYSYIDIFISRCNNSTRVNKRRKCFSPEIINYHLQNTFISFKFLDNSINHQNPVKVPKIFLRSEALPVSSTIFKRNWYFFKNVNYTSDSGLIFQSPETDNFFQISKPTESVDLRKEGFAKGSFSQLTMTMDKVVDSYYRTFQKAQQTLANIGGLIKGLMTMALILNYIFSQELYFMELIKSVFSEFYSNEIEREKKLSKLFGSRRSHLIEICVNSVKLNNKEHEPNSRAKIFSEVSINKINNYVNKENNSVKSKKQGNVKDKQKIDQRTSKNQMQLVKKNITLTYMERLLPYCCFKNSEIKMKLNHYNLVKNFIKNQICIKTIITKMNELEKLKHAILNKEQLNILDNIDNPPFSILYTKNIKKIESVWKDVLNIDEYPRRPFNQIYFNLKKQETKSEIDNNLINLIERIEKMLS